MPDNPKVYLGPSGSWAPDKLLLFKKRLFLKINPARNHEQKGVNVTCVKTFCVLNVDLLGEI